jgi:hypothetical protein
MLLDVTMYSRLDIRNVVRERSKCMDGATLDACHEMLWVIEFVTDTNNPGLKIEQKIEDEMSWNLKIFSDSDWEGYPEKGTSVTVYFIVP